MCVGCYHLTNKCLLWLVSAGHSAYWGSGHAKYRTEGRLKDGIFKARQNTTGDPFLQHVVSIQSDDYTTSFTSVRALRNSDVFAAVRIIASDIASSPIQLVKTICHKLIMNCEVTKRET